MTNISNAVNNLKHWAEIQNFSWNDQATARFERYLELILHYQKQTNLTGFNTAQQLVDEMVIDSLQILHVLDMRGTAIDVGSGAGFPGIPLKIMNPDVNIHLVEPRTKRYAFLKLVGRELGFANYQVSNKRIEQLELDQVDIAISKAFTKPTDWINLCRPWAETQGATIACYFSKSDYDSSVKPLLQSESGWKYAIHQPDPSRVCLALSRE